MSANPEIMAAVGKALRGELAIVGDKPGNCLRDVRLILEDAFHMPDGDLYRHYRTEIVETPSAESSYRQTRAPHARDMERSLKAQGMEIDRWRMQPGDLLFNWRAAPYDRDDWEEDFPDVAFPDEIVYIGHVGIYYGQGLFVENINPAYRHYGLTRKNLSLTPLELYERYQGEITTVVRFKPKEAR